MKNKIESAKNHFPICPNPTEYLNNLKLTLDDWNRGIWMNLLQVVKRKLVYGLCEFLLLKFLFCSCEAILHNGWTIPKISRNKMLETLFLNSFFLSFFRFPVNFCVLISNGKAETVGPLPSLQFKEFPFSSESH